MCYLSGNPYFKEDKNLLSLWNRVIWKTEEDDKPILAEDGSALKSFNWYSQRKKMKYHIWICFSGVR